VIAAQALKIQHTSNILHTMEPLRLAKLMVESSKHLTKVFFANTGTEANEGALKLARKYHLAAAMTAANGGIKPPAYSAFGCKSEKPTSCFTQGGVCGCWPQSNNNDVALRLKTDVVAFKGSFHGRTMGALAATHKPQIRMPFAPFPADVRFARFNNMADVLKVWTPKVGVVIIEPVQGEGGIFPGDDKFMADLRALATERGALIIVDEVQCGLGRTGRLWAHEAYENFAPDMMTLAKPLAGGLPIGAIMMTDAVAGAIAPGDHGTTYGGNPFVAAAAEHVFARIAKPAFLAASRARGAQLLAGCRAIAKDFPHVVRDVRGTKDGGLFVGVDLIPPFKGMQVAAEKRGLLLISAGENTVRLAPPLVITEAEIAFGLKVMREAMTDAYGPKA
jgi:acetylornithine aminotransferase